MNLKLSVDDLIECGNWSSVKSTTLFSQILMVNEFSSLSGLSLEMKISTSKKIPGTIPKTSKIQGGIGNQNSQVCMIGRGSLDRFVRQFLLKQCVGPGTWSGQMNMGLITC